MNVGRNVPCPCGSGKKFKKCCGAVIGIAPALIHPSSHGQRDCGDCTACCDGWLKGTIDGHEMRPGTVCHFVRDGGCSIYERRPQSPCRDFVCGWVAPNSPFPDAFKPNRAGVIIVPITWRSQVALRLVSAGRDPDRFMLQWMMDYSQRTGRPFFYEAAGETIAYGSPAFQQEMQSQLHAGKEIF